MFEEKNDFFNEIFDYKYDKICERYEKAINELQVAQNTEKQSGRSF